MTFKKIIGVALASAIMTSPALAQQASMDAKNMDGKKMDHSQMTHDGGDHNHAGMKADSTAEDAPAQGASIIVAKVNGLVCDFCAQALKKVFKKEAAVESLNIDLDAGEVRIALKAGQTLSDETVAKLIRKSGYSLVSTQREDGA